LYNITDPNMNVQREGRLPAGQLAHRAVDGLMPITTGNPHLAPHRGRMGPRAGGTQTDRSQLRRQYRAQALHLVHGITDHEVGIGRELHRCAMSLPGDPRAQPL
jgi:hypothetical protein